jgi:translation initiation factor IF-3
VLLIDAKGTKVGVVPIDKAIEAAREAGMDLVEVAPDARPPVCKVMDYGKFKYMQKRKQKSRRGHQSQMKEVRLRPKTDVHDLEVKARRCREFLSKGDKVLINMIFRGRELGHTDLAKASMLRFAEMLDDVSKIEVPPAMQGRRMTMTLRSK